MLEPWTLNISLKEYIPSEISSNCHSQIRTQLNDHLHYHCFISNYKRFTIFKSQNAIHSPRWRLRGLRSRYRSNACSCSTNCISAGYLSDSLCSSDGTCTYLKKVKAHEAEPAPQSAEIECWDTCATDCESAGNIWGGLRSAHRYVLLRITFQI